MCHKYRFGDLYQEAYEVMTREFPSRLENYKPYHTMEVSKGYEIDIINLAQQLSISSILPTAFYNLTAFNRTELVLTGNREEKVPALSPANRDAAILGKEKLFKVSLAMIRTCLDVAGVAVGEHCCLTCSRCKRYARERERSFADGTRTIDVLLPCIISHRGMNS